jgi:hypothetical protein
MGDFLYLSIMKNLFKSLFGKKEVTKEDKVVNLIIKFIKDNYNFTEYISNGDVYCEWRADEFPGLAFYYEVTHQRLTYRRELAQEIHYHIPDNRLLQPDSVLMGEVFEKLYKKKVRDSLGFSYIVN